MSRHDPFFRELFRDYDAVTVPVHGRIAAQDKADGSSVTAADREVSSLALSRLKAHTPDHGVISEEEAEPYLPSAKWRWAMDPLDGTAAFARGLPIWGIGIGLLDQDEPREGYLHFPLVNETYAFRDGVGLLNGKPITPPSTDIAADCRNVMITSIHSYVDVRRVAGFRLHNLGSNLYHMLALATGRCEAIVTGPCYVWDLAPALPFTRALGHVERFLDGSPLLLSAMLGRADFGFPIRQPLFVGPPAVVASLIEMLSGAKG
jgi:myo-inositol-1(or 4)-monophosphatase